MLRIRDTRIPLVNLFTDTDHLLSEKIVLHIPTDGIVSISLINFVSENLLLSKSVIFSVKKANLRIALSRNFPTQGMVLIMTCIF